MGMTTPPVPESALARQLVSDMEAISSFTPKVDRWAGELEMLRALEREKERTRVLVGYVTHLLDRVERLEL
jgi:hypothetical protein